MSTDVRGYDGGPFTVEMCPHGCSDPSGCDICIDIMAERQKAGPEDCNCDQALELKAQLREAAAHLGDVLAVLSNYKLTSEADKDAKDEAREWIRAYVEKIEKVGG